MLKTLTLVIMLFLLLVINHMSCESSSNFSSSVNHDDDDGDDNGQQQQQLVINSSDINSVVDINETSVVVNQDQVDDQKVNETQDEINHDQELSSSNNEIVSETNQVNEQETTQVTKKPIEEESNEKKLFGMPSIKNNRLDNNDENFDLVTTREEVISSINYPLAFKINPFFQRSLTEYTFLENYLLSSSNSMIVSPLISFLSQKNPIRLLLKLLLKSLSNSF